MASDATTEHPESKIFLGGMPPNLPRTATGLRPVVIAASPLNRCGFAAQSPRLRRQIAAASQQIL